MFDNSAYYGLQNPGFTKDIGRGFIDKMYPTIIDPISGTLDYVLCDGASMINNGQPLTDVYRLHGENSRELKRDKQGNFIKKLFIGGAIIGLSALLLRKFKNVIPTNLKTGASKAWNNVKAQVGKIFNKFKKTSP